MLKHFFYLAYRTFINNKTVVLINVLSLALAVTVFIFLILFVKNEFQTDRFIDNRDLVYRLEKDDWGILGTAYGPDAKANFPEIKEAVRLDVFQNSSPYVKVNNEYRPFEGVVYADKGFFDVFSFAFLAGNRKNALEKPFSLVLTESSALNLFGNTNVIGESLLFDNGREYQISGIIQDEPGFHVPLKAVVPLETLGILNENDDFLTRYDSWNFPTYFLLNENVSVTDLERKINAHFLEKLEKVWGSEVTGEFRLRPLKDIYFTNEIKYEINIRHGNKDLLYVLILIAFFVLFIAIINFINLTIARSAFSAKQYAMFRILGSNRRQLIAKVLMETFLLVVISFTLAFLLIHILLPEFQSIAQTDFSLDYQPLSFLWLLIAGGIILTTILSGIYPAFYLSSFNPVQTIKNKSFETSYKSNGKNWLITFQYVISILLITGTFIVYQQVEYLKNKELGFDKEHIVYFQSNKAISQNTETFRNELLQLPGVEMVSYAAQPAGKVTWQESYEINGKDHQFTYQPIDPYYLDLMGIPIKRGEGFTIEKVTDKGNSIVLNETAMKTFGLTEDSVGSYISVGGGKTKKFLGLVNDFHYNTLTQPIAPMVMEWRDISYHVHVKVTSNIKETLAQIEDLWQLYETKIPFTYAFIDQAFDSMYQNEERIGKMFGYAAVIVIIIASMGLFGLSLFTIQRKTKEIGVRKVLGANIFNVIILLTGSFTKVVIVAFLLSVPLAYYGINQWIMQFPYHLDINPWIFIVSGIITYFTAVFTISWHTWQAARKNPVESLRYE